MIKNSFNLDKTRNNKRLGVGIILQDQNENYILHLRDKNAKTMTGQWSLVGGEVNKDEDPETAAVREVKEETNLNILEIKRIKKINFNSEWNAIIFKATVNTNIDKIKISEGKKLSFFSKAKLINHLSKLKYSNLFLETLKESLGE